MKRLSLCISTFTRRNTGTNRTGCGSFALKISRLRKRGRKKTTRRKKNLHFLMRSKEWFRCGGRNFLRKILKFQWRTRMDSETVTSSMRSLLKRIPGGWTRGGSWCWLTCGCLTLKVTGTASHLIAFSKAWSGGCRSRLSRMLKLLKTMEWWRLRLSLILAGTTWF